METMTLHLRTMRFIKEYIMGWALGLAASLYGIFAIITGQAFLPGLNREQWALGGRGGRALALAYLCGGVFLLIRMVLEKKSVWKRHQALFYTLENALLIVVVGAVIYILVRVETTP